MAIIRVVEAFEEHQKAVDALVEERKKNDAPDTWDVGDYSDAQISAAVDAINKLVGTAADPNYVPVPWPVVLTAIPAAALDFGNVTQVKVKLSDLAASQSYIKRDRLIWHTQNPGQRQDKQSPFVSMPITTEDSIIVDGHHALAALFYLAGADLEVPVWSVPLGLASGHPRGA